MPTLLPARTVPLILLVFLSASACSEGPLGVDEGPLGPVDQVAELPRSLSEAERLAVQANNSLGLALLKAAAASQGPGANVVVSPLATSTTLALLSTGAEGGTFEELGRLLSLEELSQEEIGEAYAGLLGLLSTLDPSVELDPATSLWVREGLGIRTEFRTWAQERYGTHAQELDFSSDAAPRAINDWVRDRTEGRVQELVTSSFHPLTVLVTGEALVFDGAWSYQFDPARTQRTEFTLRDGSTVRSVTMQPEDHIPFRYFTEGSPRDYVVLEVPFGGGAYVLTFVLPSIFQEVHDFLASLDEERWEEVLDSLRDTLGQPRIPRLRVDEGTLLARTRGASGPLQALGMDTVLDWEKADLSGLSASGSVVGPHVDQMAQSSWLQLQETGRELPPGWPPGPVAGAPTRASVDRPFLFALRERLTGTILMMGVVEDPRAL